MTACKLPKDVLKWPQVRLLSAAGQTLRSFDCWRLFWLHPPHPTPSSAASPSSKGALAGASLCLPWAVLSWSIALISSWELMIQWYHLSTLTLAIVGEFTPQKSANVANQGFSFPGEPIYQHTSECSLCIINVECLSSLCLNLLICKMGLIILPMP